MQRQSTIHIALIATLLTSAAAQAQHEEAVAEALKPYWEREAIVAVQPRAVSKAGAVELAAIVSVIPTDPSWVYVPIGAGVAYHFSERWALQGSFAYYLASQTSHASKTGNASTAEQQLRSTLSLLWAPAYGKVSLYGRIVHLEFQLAAGGGVLRTLEERALRVDASWRPTFHLGAGLAFFAGRRFIVRLAYRQHLYVRPAEGLGWPASFGLDLGVLLGGRR